MVDDLHADPVSGERVEGGAAAGAFAEHETGSAVPESVAVDLRSSRPAGHDRHGIGGHHAVLFGRPGRPLAEQDPDSADLSDVVVGDRRRRCATELYPDVASGDHVRRRQGA